jgi:hypothetical protein
MTDQPDAPEGGTTPEGADAVRAVAESKQPNTKTAANALAYFMGEAAPPGRDDRFPLAVDFGTLEEPNFQPCKFRPLANEELVKCEEMAAVKNDDGVIERIDPFVRWSYIYAYACVAPNLAEALAYRREQKQEFPDTAALVRDVFRFQPGVLQQVAYKIEERSRLGQDSKQAVREVEAGKGSS